VPTPETVRERRAKSRSRSLMIRTKKKSHRTVEVADPDFGGAGIEIEGAFFGDEISVHSTPTLAGR